MGWLRSRSSVQLALTVLLALAIAYGLQRYLVGIFRVPSGSMARRNEFSSAAQSCSWEA